MGTNLAGTSLETEECVCYLVGNREPLRTSDGIRGVL